MNPHKLICVKMFFEKFHRFLFHNGPKAGIMRMYLKEDFRVNEREEMELQRKNIEETDCQDADILEEIEIEDFAVDGICGVY